jgi:glucosylceramidase
MMKFSRQAARVGALLLAAAGASASAATPATPQPSASVQVWLSTADKSKQLSHEPAVAFAPARRGVTTITIDSASRYQSIVGFGAAITDSSAWLIVNKVPPTERAALMQELFGNGDGVSTGLGLSFARLSIGGSDFSLTHYSLDDMPPGQTDPELKHFSIDMNRADVIPVTKQALAINPRLTILGSPWSAPAWMKTGDHLVQGTIKPEAYPAFAQYLGRYVDAYRAEGIPIHALTLQNEPHYEPKNYPGMRFESIERAKFIGQYLGPLLAKQPSKVQIWEWDHNWDEPEAPKAALADPAAAKYIDAVAWHCYLGDVKNQSIVHDAHPEKDVYMTECSPLRRAWFTTCKANGDKCPDSQSAVNWADTLEYFVRTEIIDTTRNWARGVQLWNLALDENHGPRSGGCDVCRGVVTVDSHSGAISRGVEYYTLAHASRFVRPGAVRIASDRDRDGIHTVAFQNADDGSIALIAVNAAKQPRTFAVRAQRRSFSYTLAPGSVATFTWK